MPSTPGGGRGEAQPDPCTIPQAAIQPAPPRRARCAGARTLRAAGAGAMARAPRRPPAGKMAAGGRGAGAT
eukprot:4066221-Pyramimonas_sp.AAC.1